MTPPRSPLPGGDSPADDIPEALRKRLKTSELSFHDFMELALYAPGEGYYERPANPVAKDGDYVTSAVISPVFAFALARLAAEFLARTGDAVCSIVDIGCGSGELIRGIARELPGDLMKRARLFGVDRSLQRVAGDSDLRLPESGRRLESSATGDVRFSTSLDAVDWSGPALVLANELYDAFPVARLVQRTGGLHELTVTLRDGALDWGERPAAPEYVEYFASRGIELDAGQFADVSLEWERFYARLAARVTRALVVTIDYGLPEKKLFSGRIRRYGTAAAFWNHQVNRDLLARPGRQDLTAHINFTDLERAGESEGMYTLFFGRQAGFLLSIGITEHPLFRPLEDGEFERLDDAVEAAYERQAARRLVLPEGIGEEMKVLIQGRGVQKEGWSFQSGIV